MAKRAYYFPHDYGARNDPKIQMLLAEYGVAGVGIYWCIIEHLYEQGGRLPISACKSIAFVLHVDTNVVQNIIECSGLFEHNDVEFWSSAVNTRLEKQKEVSQQRRKASETRWKSENNCKRNANVKQNDANKIKEKEIKENNNITHTISHTSEVELTQDLRDNQNWQENILMRFKTTKDELLKYIDDFELEQKCKNTTHANDADIKAHFVDWLRIQLQQHKKEHRKELTNGKSKQRNYEKDIGFDVGATSAEDYSDWLQD